MTVVAPAAGGDTLSPDHSHLAKIKLWDKLQRGDLHTVTLADVTDFFDALDEEHKGEISVKSLQSLQEVPDLALTEEDIQALMHDCDQNGNGKVSTEEFFKALTQGDFAYGLLMESLHKSTKAAKANECQREDLIDWLHDEYDTNSALWSMPQTLLLFLVFFINITIHLQSSNAYDMQTALLNEIEGEGAPYLHDHPDAIVHDVPTLWQWMQSSFASAHFKNDLDVWPYPGRLASYNQIVGGVQLTLTKTSPSTCEQSANLRDLYDTQFGGLCHKGGSSEVDKRYLLYHERVEDIVRQLEDLQAQHWIDQNSTQLDIGILFYNAHLQAFTLYHLDFFFKPDGLVKIVFSMETFLSDPYYNMFALVPDIIFAFILLRMLYAELKELIPATLNGLDGLLAYLEFWNIVDWCAIIGGATVMTLWGFFYRGVAGSFREVLGQLPVEVLDSNVTSRRAFLTPEELEEIVSHESFYSAIEEIHDMASNVAYIHETLRFVVFFFLFVLMMKFFKAFRANPRLNIVIQTMIQASTDLAHFGIVFFVIFLVFSSAAYVFFGPKIKAFSGQRRALLMCWRILMGEFDVDEMELVNMDLAQLWFLGFTVLVLLILLNMLLAIIMDTYTEVKGQKEHPIEIWRQVKEAVKTLRETRGHLDLWYLICEFDDDDFPAHPGKLVTSRTLKKAFAMQKMTKHNSDYMIRRTVMHKKEKEGLCDLSISDAMRVIGLVKMQTLKIAEQTEMMLAYMKDDRRKPQEARYDAIMMGLDPDDPKILARLSRGGTQGNLGALPPVAASRRGSQQSLPSGQAAWLPENRRLSSAPPPLPARAAFGVDVQGVPVAGGGPPGDSGADLTMLQTLVEEIRVQQQEERDYRRQRDEWIDRRLSDIENRSEKVQKGFERLFVTVQGFNMEELKALVARSPDQSAVLSSDFGFGGAASPTGSKAATLEACKRLEHKVDKLNTEIGALMAHAEENCDMRKMMWKMDLTLRQIHSAMSGLRPSSAAPSSGNAAQGNAPAAQWAEIVDRPPHQPSKSSNGDYKPATAASALRAAAVPRPPPERTAPMRPQPPPSRQNSHHLDGADWTLPGTF